MLISLLVFTDLTFLGRQPQVATGWVEPQKLTPSYNANLRK